MTIYSVFKPHIHIYRIFIHTEKNENIRMLKFWFWCQKPLKCMHVCFGGRKKMGKLPHLNQFELPLVLNQAETIEMQMLMTVDEGNHSYADRICVWKSGHKGMQWIWLAYKQSDQIWHHYLSLICFKLPKKCHTICSALQGLGRGFCK